MAEAFADTSGWASYLVPSQPFHAAADATVKQWLGRGIRVVTTNYVLTELIALLTSPLRVPRPKQVAVIESITNASWVEIVHVDVAQHAAAWNLLRSRLDKDWSLVDCASFVVMQQRGMVESLTQDHHFEQAGFVRLLK